MAVNTSTGSLSFFWPESSGRNLWTPEGVHTPQEFLQAREDTQV
jgi:hypothetical protein